MNNNAISIEDKVFSQRVTSTVANVSHGR